MKSNDYEGQCFCSESQHILGISRQLHSLANVDSTNCTNAYAQTLAKNEFVKFGNLVVENCELLVRTPACKGPSLLTIGSFWISVYSVCHACIFGSKWGSPSQFPTPTFSHSGANGSYLDFARFFSPEEKDGQWVRRKTVVSWLWVACVKGQS